MNCTQNPGPQFAAALDAEDYALLAELLSPDCEYETAKGVLVGPESIIASYREAGSWGRANLDSFTFESAVRLALENSATVTFTDHLASRGLTHTYSCQQSISLRSDGKIFRITHQELPSQREALDDFFRRAGLKRADR